MVRGGADSAQEPELEDDWHAALAAAIRDHTTLLHHLRLDAVLTTSSDAAREFPLRVPWSYVKRMQVGDPHDPLLRQVLPVDEELQITPRFTKDPVADGNARVAQGLLQKYQGRGLLIATGTCAVHCRYCFRRHYPYQEEPKTLADWEPALAHIEHDRTLREVILSGGDPLLLTDQRLEELITRVQQISHVTRLRIHTRLPIVLPNRVTDELLEILRRTRLTPIMVVHANHANELVDDAAGALQSLVRQGITTLNQSVLLRRVNDSVSSQRDLCERLVDLGVLPYYLHQLDPVAGASHFEVPLSLGREIVRELQTRLPGYAVPRYVRELPGQPQKTPLL